MCHPRGGPFRSFPEPFSLCSNSASGWQSLPTFLCGQMGQGGEQHSGESSVCLVCVWKVDFIIQSLADCPKAPSGPCALEQRRDAEGALLAVPFRVTPGLPCSGCFMDSSLESQPEHPWGRAYLGVQSPLVHALPVGHGQVDTDIDSCIRQIAWSASVSQALF